MTSEIKYLVIGLEEQLKGAEQAADFIIVTKKYIEGLEQPSKTKAIKWLRDY